MGHDLGDRIAADPPAPVNSRQMELSVDGLPPEIYGFKDPMPWVGCEGIQSDVFDHLLSILPEFGLRVFQHPGGAGGRGATAGA